MKHSLRMRAALMIILGTMLWSAPAGAQEDDGFDGTGDRRVPTAARRARDWRGSSDPSGGAAWHFSAGAGFAFFSGDAVDDEPGFAAEVKIAREMTGDFYVVGSYFLAVVQSETGDPDGGTDEDDHLLHVPTIGIGLRLEATPSVTLFVEPKVGAVFGDADAGPVGGATAGVNFEIQPGLDLRADFTGLFTDSTLDTDAGDADLDGIFAIGVGLVFEF